jgi:ABC-type uncharacterized transport system auxiliary subunit
MRRRHLPTLVLLLGALLADGGCLGGKRAPQIRYYTVALGAEKTHLPFAVRVGNFGAVPPYRSTRIALRRSRFRLDYYDFNRWAANPQSLLAAAVQNYFDRIGNPPDPDPIEVNGRIDRLEAVALDGALRAVAAITFDAHHDDRVLLQRAYVEKVPVDGEEPEDVVAALSTALDRILGRFAADLVAAQ